MSAYLSKSASFTASYIDMVPTACNTHATYTPLCGACTYREVSVSVALSADIPAMILDDDGDVYEWITPETPIESAQNFATHGKLVVMSGMEDIAPVRAAIREAELYADCFGGE